MRCRQIKGMHEVKIYEYQQQIIIPHGGLEIIDNIQTLWILYVMWERSSIIGKFFTVPTQLPAQNRVFEIPLEFFNVLRVYYDEDFARQFQNFLSNRINIETNILNAMITNDQNAVNTYTQDYVRNSDDIAKLLGHYSYWSESQWKTYLYKGMQLHLQDILAFLTGDYQNEISIFEQIIKNAQDTGRYMASGIVGSIR